ncbi:MAG TPA: DNA-3-methyladenine glycosylase [Caulobacteraceae bacterium]|nr:DNA-3-methyladenine glycosylase [Caulobacteraceae bacterium]
MRSPALADRPMRRLTRAELPTDAVALARYLIGKTLTHDRPEGRASGRIVETEAYPPGDPAAHSFVGETARNRSLFRERGVCYVYLGYGVSWLVNVAAESEGVGAGVLFRALEPLDGHDLMLVRRGREPLATGPGRLAKALGVDRAQDGLDLCAPGPLWLGAAVGPTGDIGASVRIGITKAVERPWRFYERGNPFVSGPKRLSP